MTSTTYLKHRCNNTEQIFAEELVRTDSIIHAIAATFFTSCGKCLIQERCMELACSDKPRADRIVETVEALDTPKTPEHPVSIPPTNPMANMILTPKTALVRWVFKRPITAQIRAWIFKRVLSRCGNCAIRFQCVDLGMKHIEQGKGFAGAAILIMMNCKQPYSWSITYPSVVTGQKVKE